MAEATDDDVMTLVYTSGTTGPPKGAMLTNANFTYCLDVLVNDRERVGDQVPVGPDDILLTYLPLCHVAERIFSTWTHGRQWPHPQLRRVDRHRSAEPPGDPAHHLLLRCRGSGRRSTPAS